MIQTTVKLRNVDGVKWIQTSVKVLGFLVYLRMEMVEFKIETKESKEG